MCDISVLNENIESEELSISDFCDEKPEVKEMKLIMEDSTSPITEKRYQQLRRLNLVDSDSSTSENDDRNYDVENMRDKLFKRSSEFSDVLGNENDNVHPNHEIQSNLIQNYKKMKTFQNRLTIAWMMKIIFGNNVQTPMKIHLQILNHLLVINLIQHKSRFKLCNK